MLTLLTASSVYTSYRMKKRIMYKMRVTSAPTVVSMSQAQLLSDNECLLSYEDQKRN